MSSLIETQPSLLNDKSSQSTNHIAEEYTNEETVGALIKRLRCEKGLSQKDLAQRCNITPVQQCRIENNDCIPSKQSLKMISGQIGIPYSKLLIKAGYNHMSGEKIFYKKDGTKLDVDRLISTIYEVDSDLLSYFHDFKTFGTPENVEVLMLILKAMRKEDELCKTSSSKDSLISEYFTSTFQAMKKFIISSLKPITG